MSPGGLVVELDASLVSNRRRIIDFAAHHRLPTVYRNSDYIPDGEGMAYFTSIFDTWRRLATYVDGREPMEGRVWPFRRLAPVVAIALIAAATQTAAADSDADKAAIVQRLQRWTAAFNAKDVAGVCDLFAADLVYSIPEVVRGTRETMCSNLATLQGRSDIKLHYDNPDVHEILVAGDVAIVRLTWTLTTEVNGARDTTTEEGMDIFRRQPDGRWSIARFIAFTTRANKLLR